MESAIRLTKPAFERLVEHLVSMEETADATVDYYFPDKSEVSANIKKLLAEYMKRIETELKSVVIVASVSMYRTTKRLNEFPIAAIGSEIILQNLLEDSEDKVRLVHPDEKEKTWNTISYLSDNGLALLLKNTGSEVDLVTPKGISHYRIKTIKLL